MDHKLTSIIAVLMLASLAQACTFLGRPKQPLKWHVTLEIESSAPLREEATKQAASILEARLNALGISSSRVEIQGDPAKGRILVNLPAVSDRERLKQLLTAVGRLELLHVISPPSPAPVQVYETEQDAIASLGKSVPADRRVLPYLERAPAPVSTTSHPDEAGRRWAVVAWPAVVDGSELRNAVALNLRGGLEDYGISFSLGPDGAKKFGDWTASNINEYLAVALNGEIKSIAFIKSQILDQGEISGRFSKQAAEDLALILRSGALPGPVRIVEEGAN